VRQSPVTPIVAGKDGRIVRLVGFDIDGLAEGSYDLVLAVLDQVTGVTVERHEPVVLSSDARL
jgi:hypothetical protein